MKILIAFLMMIGMNLSMGGSDTGAADTPAPAIDCLGNRDNLKAIVITGDDKTSAPTVIEETATP